MDTNDRIGRHHPILQIFTLIKFVLPVVFSIFSLRLTHNFAFCGVVLAESLIVFLLTDIIAVWNAVVAWVVGVILMFTVYAQTATLVFTGGYVQLIMLTNLDSLEALSGRSVQYGLVVALSIIALLLPVTYIKLGFTKHSVLVLLACLLAVCWVPFVFRSYSPYANLVILIRKFQFRSATEQRIRDMMGEDSSALLAEFYNESIGDGIERPSDLPEQPNVVLIFTEGLSMDVVNNPREIMPNVAYYMDRSLHFENYYDHTAATFRGIIGQLYSSHQYNNGDTNVLVSIQSILQDEGYETSFINSEPNNPIFTEYLASMGFMNLTSGGIEDQVLTDAQTYQTVLDTLVSGASTGAPQFVVTYTFGTHVGNNSPSDEFGDGSNWLLNRFHCCDAAFGQFMEGLHESGLGENTLVVFTADHATYVDDEYILTFYPEYARYDSFCDTMPLMFYYERINPETVDACGRNSLDLAPTLLDYLDVDSPNYFLGSSLFGPAEDELVETVFFIPDGAGNCYTGEEELRRFTDEELADYMAYIERYLALTERTDNPVP